MPGGALNAFCDPLNTMSSFCLSTLRGSAASEATASTINSAPSSSATLRNGSSCVTTPDEVSPCARPTILIFLPAPALRTSSGSTAVPYGASTLVTFAGERSAISYMRSENQIKVEVRSEEHTSELQSHLNLVCRLLLEKKKKQRCLNIQ